LNIYKSDHLDEFIEKRQRQEISREVTERESEIRIRESKVFSASDQLNKDFKYY
jgi:hypothetical protein